MADIRLTAFGAQHQKAVYISIVLITPDEANCWANAANTLKLDPWTTRELGARYVLAAGSLPLNLRGGVDNITNERDWASAFDTFSSALLQRQPRTAKASISADF